MITSDTLYTTLVESSGKKVSYAIEICAEKDCMTHFPFRQAPAESKYRSDKIIPEFNNRQTCNVHAWKNILTDQMPIFGHVYFVADRYRTGVPVHYSRQHACARLKFNLRALKSVQGGPFPLEEPKTTGLPQLLQRC